MPEPPQLNPAALSIPDLARVLTLAGGQRIDVPMLERDIADGVPTNADGTVNVVHYTAWLVKEMSRRGRD